VDLLSGEDKGIMAILHAPFDRDDAEPPSLLLNDLICQAALRRRRRRLNLAPDSGLQSYLKFGLLLGHLAPFELRSSSP
jgi:hypothetical protein